MAPPSTARVLLSLAWDSCCAPPASALQRELVHLRAALAADLRQLRLHGVLRRRPEKGVLRIVLLLGWVALHLFALLTFILYRAFDAGPVHAAWWLGTTILAGIMYTSLMYSNPGFIDHEQLQKLTKGLDVDITVPSGDTGRGLLKDVEGDFPAMSPMLPVNEEGDGEFNEKREGLLAAADAQEKKLSRGGETSTTRQKSPTSGADESVEAHASALESVLADSGTSEIHVEIDEPASSEAVAPESNRPARQGGRVKVAPQVSQKTPDALDGGDKQGQGGSSSSDKGSGAMEEAKTGDEEEDATQKSGAEARVPGMSEESETEAEVSIEATYASRGANHL